MNFNLVAYNFEFFEEKFIGICDVKNAQIRI